MIIDDSNKRVPYIFAGILIVLTITIIVGFALAIDGSIDLSNGAAHQDFVGFPFQSGSNSPELESLEDDIPEFVAERGCECYDTEKGTIEVIRNNIPDMLPLCLTQDILDTWTVVVKVKGGYDPIDGEITLCQKGEYKGTIDVDWKHVGHEPCYYDYWEASFTLVDGEPIELDSNQWPDGAIPLVDNPTIPGKKVLACWCTLWKGCDDEDQMFRLIQTQ